MIQLRDVHVTYRHSSRASLSGFNLSVQPGEFVLLTGKSGCGKTTVTRLLNGLIPHFFAAELTGDVFVGGLDIRTASMRDIARRVGSVFQDPRSQFFTLHVSSELAFPSENYGIGRESMQAQIKNAIQQFELRELLTRTLGTLSSGEKQKVAMASVYALGPAVYVLDEPSANLDAEGMAQLYTVLQMLKAGGHTVVVAEHRLGYLKALVDRVVFLEDGHGQGVYGGNGFFAKPRRWFQAKGLRDVDDTAAVLTPVDPPRRRETGKTPFLQAVAVSFGYSRGQSLLRHVALDADRGEVIGIMGKNGIGKSTLLRLFMGLEQPTQGKILLDGRASGKAARLRHSFYVMQDVDYQLFAPSVWEEMLLGCKASPALAAQAEQYLRFFQLEDYKEAHPASLSGGQKQRLAIALSCMRTAPLLFLDEPTSGLDGENMGKVSRFIRELARAGRCIFVISHDYQFAASTFDKILWLEEDGTLSSRAFAKEIRQEWGNRG